MYIAIPHLSPIGLSVIHQADEKYVNVTFQRILSHPPREIGLKEASLLACIYLEMRQVEYLGTVVFKNIGARR